MKNNSVLTLDLENIRIRVSLKGIFSLEHKTKSLMHSHAAFELHILLGGSAELETEDKLVTLNQGDAVLVAPDVFHKFSKEEKGTTIASISFFLSRVQKTGSLDYESILRQELMKENDLFLVRHNNTMIDCLKKIIALLYSKRPFVKENLRAMFVMLFTELFTPLVTRDGTEVDEANEGVEYDTRIAMIETYFNDYYMKDISLKHLAELLYLSEKQTYRMIEKAFGTGFRKQLNKMRIRSAKKFLRDGEKDVRQVAEAVGFQSYNGFYTAFKRETGTTPLAYRRQYQKEFSMPEGE